jgi:hypothetical protein
VARRAAPKPKPPPAPGPLPTREQEPRRFLLELLAVTLGVLLALILEQAATSWRASQRVSDIKAAMDKEISDYAEIFHLRVRIDPCIGSKLDALEAHVAGGGGTRVTGVGRPSYFFSGRSAFSSDATDQLTRYLGADVVQKYGEIYQGMDDFAGFSGEEQKIWVTLQTLEGDSDPIGPDRRAHLREALVGARNTRLLLHAIATQMLERAAGLGVKRNRSLDAMRTAELPLCRPLAQARS